MLKEFKQFLLRGNVVDLAVGVVIGSAFGAITTSLVADVLTPLISAVARIPDFSGWIINLSGSELKIGKFVNALISFVLVGGAVFFFVVKPMNLLIKNSKKEPEASPTTKKCKECLSEIPLEAKRCAHCSQVVA